MVVVLPAPFGPRKPNTSPWWTSKLTPASESFGAFGYRFTKSVTSTASFGVLSVSCSLFNWLSWLTIGSGGRATVSRWVLP